MINSNISEETLNVINTSFYGIISIDSRIGVNGSFIIVSTINIGSIDVEKLVLIKKNLSSNSLTITNGKKGLIYTFKL